jgi:hypothetical protein
LKYDKKLDKTASTIDADKFIKDELKKYVEEHKILETIQCKMDRIRLENERKAMNSIYIFNNYNEEEIHKMIDQEIEYVWKLCKEATTWKMGMCLIEES